MPPKKGGKKDANEQVEQALLQLATGYTVPLAKTFKLKQVDFDPDTGKKIAEREELAVGYDETHVSANTRAQMFWLTNRAPERWSNKPEERQEETGEEGGIVFIPEVDCRGAPMCPQGVRPIRKAAKPPTDGQCAPAEEEESAPEGDSL